MYQNNILDQINSIGQELCTQPIQQQLISLRQQKNKNFLTSQSSKHFRTPKQPDIEEPKSKRRSQNIYNIKYKFQIEDDDYHNVLQKIVRINQKTHLLPIKLQYQPKGLSIGRVNENVQINSDDFPRSRHRNQSEPEEDILRQLAIQKEKHNQAKSNTDRMKKENRLCLGATRTYFNKSSRDTLEVAFNKTPIQHRTLSQKQFNVYKKRHIATPNLANQFKQRRIDESEAYKKYMKEQEKKMERSFFELL